MLQKVTSYLPGAMNSLILRTWAKTSHKFWLRIWFYHGMVAISVVRARSSPSTKTVKGGGSSTAIVLTALQVLPISAESLTQQKTAYACWENLGQTLVVLWFTPVESELAAATINASISRANMPSLWNVQQVCREKVKAAASSSSESL